MSDLDKLTPEEIAEMSKMYQQVLLGSDLPNHFALETGGTVIAVDVAARTVEIRTAADILMLIHIGTEATAAMVYEVNALCGCSVRFGAHCRTRKFGEENRVRNTLDFIQKVNGTPPVGILLIPLAD